MLEVVGRRFSEEIAVSERWIKTGVCGCKRTGEVEGFLPCFSKGFRFPDYRSQTALCIPQMTGVRWFNWVMREKRSRAS